MFCQSSSLIPLSALLGVGNKQLWMASFSPRSALTVVFTAHKRQGKTPKEKRSDGSIFRHPASEEGDRKAKQTKHTTNQHTKKEKSSKKAIPLRRSDLLFFWLSCPMLFFLPFLFTFCLLKSIKFSFSPNEEGERNARPFRMFSSFCHSLWGELPSLAISGLLTIIMSM